MSTTNTYDIILRGYDADGYVIGEVRILATEFGQRVLDEIASLRTRTTGIVRITLDAALPTPEIDGVFGPVVEILYADPSRRG